MDDHRDDGFRSEVGEELGRARVRLRDAVPAFRDISLRTAQSDGA